MANDTPNANDNRLDRLADLVAHATRRGASAAEAQWFESRALSCALRLGQREKTERSEESDLALRVFKGQRQASVSTSDFSPAALDELVARALAMADNVPDDPFCGLAERGEIARRWEDLDLCAAQEPAEETLAAQAREMEDAARAVKGITNSEGSEASWHKSHYALTTSNGFAGHYALSGHSLIVGVIAGEGTAMEREYEYHSARHAGDLESPIALGKRAGEKAVRRLHPRKGQTVKGPVVFDPRVAGTLLGHLAGAISGAAIARGTSFLKDKMGEALFPPAITITDDPLRRRGLRSYPFDHEGLAAQPRAFIDKGVLRGWFLDLRAARKLKLKSTGHAGHIPSNLYCAKGALSPQALIADIKSGLYVTEVMGTAVNLVTGDYSRGASGFWIENGVVSYPVAEMTIAGTLSEMFASLRAADDLVFRYGIDSPTLRVENMTIAGL